MEKNEQRRQRKNSRELDPKRGAECERGRMFASLCKEPKTEHQEKRDRVRRPIVDVVSAFGENDAVKTKRRAEEKRNPEGRALRRKCGEPFCAARARFDQFIFHGAAELYVDRRMIVYQID